MWYTRVAHHVVALLRADALYMKDHAHDIAHRFGRSEMTHLRNWWQSQRKQETMRQNKARGLSTTGAGGGLPLSKLVALRAEAFATNTAASKEDMTEAVRDSAGTVLRFDMEPEQISREATRRPKDGRSSQVGESAPTTGGGGAPAGGRGEVSVGNTLAQSGAHHGTEDDGTSSVQNTLDSAPPSNSVEDLVSSGDAHEGLADGGRDAGGGRRAVSSGSGRAVSSGGGRAVSSGGEGAFNDAQDIDSYPSETEHMRSETFDPLSPGAVEEASPVSRQRKRKFTPSHVDALMEKERKFNESLAKKRMVEFKEIVHGIQTSDGGAGSSVPSMSDAVVEKRKLDLQEARQNAELLHIRKSDAKEMYTEAKLAAAEGLCNREKVQELWDAYMNIS